MKRKVKSTNCDVANFFNDLDFISLINKTPRLMLKWIFSNLTSNLPITNKNYWVKNYTTQKINFEVVIKRILVRNKKKLKNVWKEINRKKPLKLLVIFAYQQRHSWVEVYFSRKKTTNKQNFFILLRYFFFRLA